MGERGYLHPQDQVKRRDIHSGCKDISEIYVFNILHLTVNVWMNNFKKSKIPKLFYYFFITNYYPLSEPIN